MTKYNAVVHDTNAVFLREPDEGETSVNAGNEQVKGHEQVGSSLQFDRLSDNADSNDLEFAINNGEYTPSVGDVVHNNQFDSNSPKYPAAWVCTSDSETDVSAQFISGAFRVGTFKFELVGGSNVLAFGAVGDGSNDDSSAILDAFTWSISSDAPLYFPNGIYILASNTIDSDMGSASRLVLHGDGVTSVIKRKDGTAEADFERMFFIDPSHEVESIEFRDLIIDSNARGSTPPDNLFDYEHSSTISLSPSGTIKNFIANNVHFKDAVADHINFADTGGITQVAQVLSCRAFDRTRTRGDVTVSESLQRLIVDDFYGDRIETELLQEPTDPMMVQLSNCNTDILDIGGTGDPGSLVLQADNITTRSLTNFVRIKTQISNSSLTFAVNNSRISNPHKDSRLSDTDILLPYDSDTGNVNALDTSTDTDVERGILFDSCHFLINAESLPVSPNGYLYYPTTNTEDTDTIYPQWRVISCKFDERAHRNVNCYRNGEWLLKDNDYSGSQFSVRVHTTTDQYVRVDFQGGITKNVSGNLFLIGGSAGGTSLLNIDGDFDESILDFQIENSGWTNSTIVSSRRIRLSGSSAPAGGGFIGDMAILKVPTAGNPYAWVCTSSSPASATWKEAMSLAS